MVAASPEFPHGVETVLVTGAIGDVGAWVVDRFADQGVEVVGVDLEAPAGTRENAAFRTVDLRDPDRTAEVVTAADPDVVVHLAAISDPVGVSGATVFENNTRSTYNVLETAGRIGVDVVWTSSQAVYGALFAAGPWIPDYLPVDEAHACRPEDAYGTSKVCGEAVAGMAVRRHGISVTSLRPATIFTPDRQRARPPRDLSDLSADESSGDFGTYLDVRDVGRLIEAAVAADLQGHEVVIGAADENYLGVPTREIVEAICGTVPEACHLEGKEAAFSNAKAEALLGWRPAHAVPEHDPDAVDGPDWR